MAVDPFSTPPPALVSKTTGDVVLTRNHPVATVEVTVRLRPSTTEPDLVRSVSYRIAASIDEPGAIDSLGAPVSASVVDLDAGRWASIDLVSIPREGKQDFFGSVQGCLPGPCEHRARIVVALADPGGERSTVHWTASISGTYVHGDPPASESRADPTTIDGTSAPRRGPSLRRAVVDDC